VPIVPGVNDAPQHIEAAARLAADLPGVRQVNVIAYHALGTHKRAAGDRTAQSLPVAPPPREGLEEVAAGFRAWGLTTVIGG
jgi:pyruvate-formate lyase-activating enzyme